MLAFVPVIWVCCHELLVRQQGSPWRWGVLLAAAVVGQFFTGTEVLAIAAMFGVAAVVVAAGVRALGWVRHHPGTSVRAAHAAKGLALATVVSAAALAYPTWFALAGPRHIAGTPWPGLMPFTGTSLSGFVTRQDTGDIAAMFRLSGYDGDVGQLGGYLGVGAVVLAAGAVGLHWRRPVAWALAATAVGAAWLSLGSVWVGGGARPAWVPFLPWATLQRLPILHSVLAQNVALVALLAVSALVGLAVDGVARAGRGLTHVTAVVAAAVLSAAVLAPLSTTWRLPLSVGTVDRPVWFVRDAPRLPAGSVVLAYPFVGMPGNGEAAVWQAMGRTHVALAGGFGLVPGRDGHADPGTAPGSATAVLAALTNDGYGALPGLDDGAARSAVRAALTAWGVTTVVVTDRGRDPAYAQRWFTTLLDRPPTFEDGAAVWSLSPAARGDRQP